MLNKLKKILFYTTRFYNLLTVHHPICVSPLKHIRENAFLNNLNVVTHSTTQLLRIKKYSLYTPNFFVLKLSIIKTGLSTVKYRSDFIGATTD